MSYQRFPGVAGVICNQYKSSTGLEPPPPPSGEEFKKTHLISWISKSSKSKLYHNIFSQNSNCILLTT